MTALTTMFNFLRVYISFFCCMIFGGDFTLSDFSGESYEIASAISKALGFGLSVHMPGSPIMQLFIAIIVIVAIIGLARRLIRG